MTGQHPSEPPVLLQVAAAMVRGDGICETGHRNGESHPHFHEETVHSWGRQLSALYHSHREAEAQRDRLRAALEQDEVRQKRALSIIEKQGFVFEADPMMPYPTEAERWEKLAFTFYTELVDSAEQARAALTDDQEGEA